MKKQVTPDAKRAAANDTPKPQDEMRAAVELVSEIEVPATNRANRTVFAETREWKQGLRRWERPFPQVPQSSA